MLTLDDVCFNYPAQTSDYEFSLQVKKSHIAAISGRSGCGKSTLLDLIAGFLQPTRGRVVWDDKDITSLSPGKRPVSIVFQHNNLFEHRNALDNVVVGINPSIPATGPDVDKAKQALNSVALAEHHKQRVSKLSGGQRQRVAIARVLTRGQGIVLLDEPFSGLDQQTKEDMLKLVRKLADTQKSAVIMVTHDLQDASAIADYHYELSNGRLTVQ